MRLPALRLAFLRGSAAATALGEHLAGTVIVLPADLPEAELAEICDLVALFVARPIHVAARAEALPEGHVCVITEPVEQDPAAVKDGVVLGVRAVEAGRRRLGDTNRLRRLRDMVLQVVSAAGTGRGEIAAWAQEVSDSPSTALRFASAAQQKALASPRSTPAELVTEGLAETLAWLLHGVDPRVAEWVLAHALASLNPGRLVSTEAALLGETAALQHALAAGLVERLPERADDVLDLRRPLALLGQLGDLSATVDLPGIAAALRPRLDPLAYRVFDRLLQAHARPLHLDPPSLPLAFLGRDEVLRRLVTLFEPSREIRTAVVYGVGGLGKSAVGAALCARLADRLEPVWLTFAGGPETAWQRVADGLGMDTQQAGEARTPARTPGWLPRVHRAMAERDALIVVDDVDEVPESELPAWLPAGPGSCVVLVLSKQAQRVLQREHDAIPVSLQALRGEEARSLLASKAPALAVAVRTGEADALLRELGNHPAAIRMAAGLLEKRSIDEVMGLLKKGDHEISGLGRPALEALDAREKAVVEALAVAARTGSPHALVARMVGVDDVGPVLDRLADRALVELGPRMVRLQGIVQLAAAGVMSEARRRELEVAHAKAAGATMAAANDGKDEKAKDEGYADAMLALGRMTERCRAGEGELADLVRHIALAIAEYPRGRWVETMSAEIAGWQAVLSTWTRESRPEDWAGAEYNLGSALVDLPVGNRAENLHRAIDAFHAALTIYTEDKDPKLWAMVQRGLGRAFAELPVGDGQVNARRAVEGFRAALRVVTEHDYPEDWARTQNGLGCALTNLLDYEQAIEAFHSALRVFTPETDPKGWAGLQNNLGLALKGLPSGNRAENIRRAIEAFRAALTVFTLPTYPRDWAMAQNNLGNALAILPEGDRGDNLRGAIEAYQAALTVYIKDTHPWGWAQTRRNLGLALAQLPSGDRRNNLSNAIDAFRSALTVYTEQDFPREHARTQAELDDALRDLAALDPNG